MTQASNPAADYLLGKLIELQQRAEMNTHQLALLSRAMADLARATQSANEQTRAALRDIAAAINDIVSGRQPIRPGPPQNPAPNPAPNPASEIASESLSETDRQTDIVESASPASAPSAVSPEKAVNEASHRAIAPPQHHTSFQAAKAHAPRSESVARLIDRIQRSQQLRAYDTARRKLVDGPMETEIEIEGE